MPQTEWIFQTLESQCFRVHLGPNTVQVDAVGPGSPLAASVLLIPETRAEANKLSMMLRKASRRIEEIGKGLP